MTSTFVRLMFVSLSICGLVAIISSDALSNGVRPRSVQSHNRPRKLAPTSVLAEALDVNDVSLLFPLGILGPFPEISAKADVGLPQSLFEQVLRFEDKTSPLSTLPYLDSTFVGDFEKWFVTSMRVDPCGEVFDLSDEKDPLDQSPLLIARRGNGCQPRLRVVIQPFNLLGNPIATAMHLLYRLDVPDVAKLLQALTTIKRLGRSQSSVDTTGVPLMLHPILVAELEAKGATPAANELKRVLTEIARPDSRGKSRLEIITMILQIQIDHWKFLGGYVRGSTWTRFVTEFSRQYFSQKKPIVATGVEKIECDRHSVCSFHPAVHPKTLSPLGVSMTHILQNSPEMETLQVPGFRDEAIQTMAEVIDRPGTTHFFNTNCVSCHESSNLRDRETLHLGFNGPSGITPFVASAHLNGHMNGIINFGYWGSSPRISTRTAAESAVAADALNSTFGLRNPAKPPGDIQKFWKCIVSEADFRDCL